MSSDENDQSANAVFEAQLYLFEAVGSAASSNAVPAETKVQVASYVITPLVTDISNSVVAAKAGDKRATLQVHHIIKAFGTLASGFSDWTPGSHKGAPPDSGVSNVFGQASEGVLVAVGELKDHLDIRTAARYSFSRFMGVLGARILPQLPRWIEGLLSSASSNDEMAMFLRLLVQVVYGFKTEISEILDQLLSPLLQKVFASLSAPISGTDDEIQLKELKLQYLNFILVILNNELGPVLVSPANQGTFDTFLTTITHFSQDPTDPPTARLALSVLTRMTSIWGGPDVAPTSTAPANPALPGFDSFVLSTFAPMPWALISAPGFSARDAQIRGVLQEAAALQWTILRKIGNVYREQLQSELRNLGAGEAGVMEFVKHAEGDDLVGFKKFFVSFVQGAKS
jgi:exportin-T